GNHLRSTLAALDALAARDSTACRASGRARAACGRRSPAPSSRRAIYGPGLSHSAPARRHHLSRAGQVYGRRFASAGVDCQTDVLGRTDPLRLYTGILMKVVIAGGTGFLGQPLAHALIAEGRQVVILTRSAPPPRRGSDEQKRQILESRVQATRALVAAILAATRRPRAFISGSAVGYYG